VDDKRPLEALERLYANVSRGSVPGRLLVVRRKPGVRG
jgi:hypothetical protein